MTLQTAKYSNFFETTLDGAVGASDTNMTLTAAPTDGASNISAPYYLVIDPDSTSKREVVLVTSASGTTLSAVTRDVEGRHSPDPSHADDITVRMAVVGEMFEDLHDRINDVALTGDVTGTISSSTQDIATTIAASSVQVGNIDFLVDEDTMSSDSAVKVPTQQSVKAYVDSGATTMTNKILKDYAETDQDVTSSSGVITIDLANGNTGSITLGENITDLDFNNVPAAGLATFTLIVTQDGTGSRTMAINQCNVNGAGHQTGLTAGGAGLTLSTAAASVDIVTFLFKDAGNKPYIFSQLAFA
tara:strand:- start:1925 stop:2830 length:906 start_codon:yes stop_codon:yes gene_type:complete